MNEFLNLAVLTKFYFWLGICMTGLFILKLIIFSATGMDDGDGDLIGTDVDDSFTFISLQSVLAFLMGFGWMGFAALEWEYSAKVSVLFAIGGGLILFFISAWLLSVMKKLNSTPKYDLNTCLNKAGTSYTKFEPKGSGKIQIEFNGRLETLDAWNESENVIESFKQIKVTKVEDGKLFVVEIGQ